MSTSADTGKTPRTTRIKVDRGNNGLGMSWWSWGPFYVEWWGHGAMLWIGRLRFKAGARVWWFRG
jgi:hypothetical protein